MTIIHINNRKYGNKVSYAPLDTGETRPFHSKKERDRFMELYLMSKVGEIKNLKLQPKFKIEVNGTKICTYIADFEYEEAGKTIVEDTKGYRTREYRIKKKLMQAVFGIEIKET